MNIFIAPKIVDLVLLNRALSFSDTIMTLLIKMTHLMASNNSS